MSCSSALHFKPSCWSLCAKIGRRGVEHDDRDASASHSYWNHVVLTRWGPQRCRAGANPGDMHSSAMGLRRLGSPNTEHTSESARATAKVTELGGSQANAFKGSRRRAFSDWPLCQSRVQAVQEESSSKKQSEQLPSSGPPGARPDSRRAADAVAFSQAQAKPSDSIRFLRADLLAGVLHLVPMRR